MNTPEQRFVAAFERLDGHTLNGSNARLQGLRKDAIEHVRILGLPRPKTEAWKYTNIEKTLRHDYALYSGGVPESVTADAVDAQLVPGLDAHVVAVVNGRFAPALSRIGDLPAGVVVTSLAEATEKHAALLDAHLGAYADYKSEVFTALNTAFTRDGFFVYVPKGKTVEKPIHVVHVTSVDADALIQPRHLIVAEEGALVKIIETHRSQPNVKTFTNAVTEVVVGARANVDHYKVQDEGDQASQVNTLRVVQTGASVFGTLTVTLSGEVVRNNLTFLPNAEGCETHLHGLFLGDGESHIDTHTLVDHAQPGCFSNENYKGILADKSTGVFNGKVFVHRDAQQTNAYQSNKSIILDPTAKMYSKPELEIYADDVKCSHGATTGQLDREALFYLQSRGITRERARAMLLVAFARDVLDDVSIEPLREMLDAEIEARFR